MLTINPLLKSGLILIEGILIALLVIFLLPLSPQILPTTQPPPISDNRAPYESKTLQVSVESPKGPVDNYELTIEAKNVSRTYRNLTSPCRINLSRKQLTEDEIMLKASKSGYITTRRPLVVTSTDQLIKINLTLLKGKKVVLKGYNFRGEAVTYQQLVGNDFSQYKNTFYLTTSNWEPLPGEVFTEKEWLAAKVPQSREVTLHLLWPVKGFGKVMLRAHLDDKSKGRIYLNQRIAETELGYLKKDLAAFSSQSLISPDYLRANIKPLVSKAERLLEKARNETAPANAIRYQKSINYTLWAGENLYLALSEARIERKKKRVRLRVAEEYFDNQEEKLRLRIEQKRRKFRFGWFLLHPQPERINQRLQNLPTNYANLFAFWWQTEPQPGQFNYSPVENKLRKLEGEKVSVSGLIGDTPKYTSRLDNSQLQEAIRNHIKQLTSKFPSLGPWECYGLGMNWGADQTLQMTRGRTKRANKNSTKTCINAVNDFTNTKPIVTGWNIDGSKINYPDFDQTPYHYFKEMNGSYQIGFDFMYFGSAHEMYPELIDNQIYSINKPEESANKIPARDLATIGRLLDHYGQLNRSMHIQYFQAPSNYNNYTLGYWHHPWNEEIQAEWLTKFYKVVYGHPQVKSINYLEVHDEKWRQIKNGLLGASGDPKKSYFALKRLLEGWRTSPSNLTLSSQKKAVVVDLWPGEYYLELSRGDKVLKRENIMVKHPKNHTIG